MNTTTEAKDVIRRYVAAVAEGDATTIRDSFAESATWSLAGYLPISGVWSGRDAIIDEFLATALTPYEPGSVSLEVTGLIAEGDRVAVQWTSRARTLDGEPYVNNCIGVFTVSDGRIQSVQEYMDTHYAFRAIHGVSKTARLVSDL